jgi:hypothetical protein
VGASHSGYFWEAGRVHRGSLANAAVERLCPYCKQVLPEFRLGVRLTPGKARLFDLILHAGDNAIATADLTEITGLSARCLKAHVWQINDALEGSGYRIRNNRWGYRLVNLARSSSSSSRNRKFSSASLCARAASKR